MFEGQKCLVIGSGISGMGAVSLLKHFGAQIILYDSKENMTKEELIKKLGELSPGVTCVTGELPREIEESVQHVVLSPGVPVDLPLVE